MPELEFASLDLGELNFALECRSGCRTFRLLGTVLGCPELVCTLHPPLGPELLLLPLGRGGALASEGGPCTMQDTPNSYLEVERRDFFDWADGGVAWAGERGERKCK